jgi:hypothetical protein
MHALRSAGESLSDTILRGLAESKDSVMVARRAMECVSGMKLL